MMPVSCELKYPQPGFKSKKVRVNLNQPIKAEVKTETAEVLKSVDEDRKFVIQATIVRYVLSIPELQHGISCSIKDNESSQDNEEPITYSGSNFTDFPAFCAKDS